MLIPHIAACALVVLFGTSKLLARDFYLTIHGAGVRDGTSWEHALGSDRLSVVFNELMQPGDRLMLGGGTYPAMSLVLSRGGEAGRAKEIVGADLGQGLPLFSGEWSVAHPAKGATAFRIEPGQDVAVRKEWLELQVRLY